MADRRQNQRLKTQGLSSCLGEVIDISDTGIGVFRKGKVEVTIGDQKTLVLSHENTEIQLSARVARIDKVGMFRHEIGFEFIDVDEQTLQDVWAMTDTACSEFTGPRCWLAA